MVDDERSPAGDRPGGQFVNQGAFTVPITPPSAHLTDRFRLVPLGPEHNERDHAAWMSSIEHIHVTPGFTAEDWSGDTWPFEMSLSANLADLVQHAAEFRSGAAFAYTVLDPRTADVIGCVYIDPDPTGAAQAMCRSWVRASHGHLDLELHEVIRSWLSGSEWNLSTVRFPGR